jgi:CheY-like chemotaxis protein
MNESTVPPIASPKLILVVDDAPQVAEIIEVTLSQLGHKVETAEDGNEALRRFEPGKYDLVITDYAMPKMNGVELAMAIRKRAPGQLILLITAFAFSIAANDATQLPVDSVLRKPFQPRELEDAITELFAAAKQTA